MNKYIIVALLSILLIPVSGYSQFKRDKNPVKIEKKQMKIGKSKKKQVKDTLTNELPSVVVTKKPHSPHKATIYAMVLPGLGQIYNRQWWKVPILYGGFTATIMAMKWNDDQYGKYTGAFIDYNKQLEYEAGNVEEPPATQRWEDITLIDVSEFTDTQKEWFKTTLKNRKDNFKRDRDMMYILMAGIYVLNIIDATVFAHFYDFDISDDLSMGIVPTMQHSDVAGNSIGLNCTIRF